MSRWHRSSCQKPDVCVDNEGPGTPRCRACNASVNLGELIDQRQDDVLPSEIPPDEPFGKMDLYWPDCVPYKRTLDAGGMTTVDAATPEMEATGALLPKTVASSIPPIYERNLDLNEFRLVNLSVANDKDSPIHMAIEICRDDDYPEYETVSYAWGGEDNNNVRDRPVYLGEYWDVQLQTKNCWSLLHYLRLRNENRAIWVDAICIDQSNILERDAQVARMADIYQRCLRVVVYLGDDIARPRRKHNRKYTPRYAFDEYQDRVHAPELNLEKLFQLRFFSRVWVIQELLLAPAALVPVHGIDFIVGSHTMKRLASSYPSWDWYTTGAPWVEYACNGYSLRTTNLLEMLRLTWRSQATDPRDRIFGILGLLQDETIAQSIKPDYSLSTLHTYIGIFAYLFLNTKHVALIEKALGRAAPPSFPSWLPDWNLHDVLWDTTWPRWEGKSDKEWENELQNFINAEEIWRKNKKLRQRFSFQLDFVDMFKFYDNERWQPETLIDVAFNKGLLWYSGAYIDPASYALSIHLIHLLKLTSAPGQYFRYYLGGCIVRTYIVRSKACTLHISTSDVPLDLPVIGSEPIDVFMLLRQETPNSRSIGMTCNYILFMRETNTKRAYKLVTACPCFQFCFEGLLSTKERDAWRCESYRPKVNFRDSFRISNNPSRTLYDRLESISTTFQDLNNQDYESSSNPRASLDTLFLSRDWTPNLLLPLCQALLDGSTGHTPPFWDLYVTIFSDRHPNSRPGVSDGYFYATVDPRVFLGYKRGPLEPQWQRKSPVKGWQVVQRSHGLGPLSSKFHVRAEMSKIMNLLIYTKCYNALFSLSHCRHLTGEDELTMLRRGPKDEDRFICDYLWPEAVINGFQTVGRIKKVTIV